MCLIIFSKKKILEHRSHYMHKFIFFLSEGYSMRKNKYFLYFYIISLLLDFINKKNLNLKEIQLDLALTLFS